VKEKGRRLSPSPGRGGKKADPGGGAEKTRIGGYSSLLRAERQREIRREKKSRGGGFFSQRLSAEHICRPISLKRGKEKKLPSNGLQRRWQRKIQIKGESCRKETLWGELLCRELVMKYGAAEKGRITGIWMDWSPDEVSVLVTRRKAIGGRDELKLSKDPLDCIHFSPRRGREKIKYRVDAFEKFQKEK